MTRFLHVALSALAAAPALAQQQPKEPPPPLPLKPAAFPPFREAVLPNGLRIVVVENRRLPIVSLSLAVPAGAVTDPAGKEGLASMVGGLLTKGAGRRTAEQISEAIEGVGGSLTAGADGDFLTVSAGVLSRDAKLAFDLVGDAVVRPQFPAAELDLLRTQTLSGLELERAQPASIASRLVAQALYGEHPYGRSATPASVGAITRADLLAFHRARVRPRGALLVVAGDLSLAEARRLAVTAFRGWIGSPPRDRPLPAPPSRSRADLVLVHRPGSVQSNIVVANLTMLPADPRYHAAAVANRILGGGADSRLFAILREQKGWTYGAYSGLTRRKGLGSFEATAEVRTEVTDSALVEILAQLRRLGSESVPANELDQAKSALVGSYPLTVQTAAQVAGAVSEVRLYGLPADYLETYRVKIGAVTTSDVLRATQDLIRPDQAVIAVVGDASKVLDKLERIGPVRLVDPSGAPLTKADLNPATALLPIDVSVWAATNDSFSVRVQGNPIGAIRASLEPTATGFRYTEHSAIGGFVEQTTTLDFGRDGSVLKVRQNGKVQGQPTAIEVDYANGRASGKANTVSPEGPKAVTIDTLVAKGTLDDNAIQPILPTLPWTPNASWTFGVFSSGQNEYRVTTLKVLATEMVKLDGGTVEAFKVDWSGGWQPATFWVTTAKPHRLVKIGIANTPVEVVRVR